MMLDNKHPTAAKEKVAQVLKFDVRWEHPSHHSWYASIWVYQCFRIKVRYRNRRNKKIHMANWWDSQVRWS